MNNDIMNKNEEFPWSIVELWMIEKLKIKNFVLICTLEENRKNFC